MQSSDAPDHEILDAQAEGSARLDDSLRTARAAELLEGSTQIHHFHFVGRDKTRLDHEVSRAPRDGDRKIGVGLEQTVRYFLKPRRVGEVRVLMQNRWN